MSPAHDTIFALSSGAPPAAIAIIRVSGRAAFEVSRHFDFLLPEPRYAAVRTLRDERGEQIDRAVVITFPADASATGELVVELHVHGGRAIVRAVLTQLQSLEGFRPALAGEFTRRALLNGKMDLLEAEALGDLLAAETEDQRRRAAVGATLLGQTIDRWEKSLVGAAASIEMALDHDEDHVPVSAELAAVRDVIDEIDDLLARVPSERLRDGFRVIIAGPPNAGKSTLLNTIAGREVVITSGTAGTTRDMVEVPLSIQGVAIRLSDSPGLRAEAADPIEQLGIERAWAAFQEADLLLWLSDMPPPSLVRSIRVAPRCDVDIAYEGAEIAVSGRTGEGVARLLDVIVQKIGDICPPVGEVTINARQRAAVARARTGLALFQRTSDMVLQAEGLREARLGLGALTGKGGIEDLLDKVFSGFCLGK